MRVPMLRLAAFAALPLVISGCDLIAAYLSPMPIGGFGDPETTTAYSTGTATVQITQGGTTQTISLDISPGSTYDSYVGAIVSWENDEGWTVMVDAYDESLLGGVSVPGLMDGDMTISRIEGHEFWTAGSYTGLSAAGCGVKVSEMTPVKVAGRVTCSQLRWTDGTSWSLDGPQYIEGQDPFDVTIDFEAEASPEPSGQTS